MRILAHAAAILGIVLLFWISLGLGLQISGLYGYIGLAGVVAFAGLYIYVGFIRN